MMNVIYLDLTQEQLDEAIAQWRARQNALMTNADRIRAMSDEELANWLNDNNFNCPRAWCPGEDGCVDCWLDWLKQEVGE